MNMFDTIITRRSTRKFLDRPVEQEKLEQIIVAGQYAPSGSNSQSSHFIVISNKETLDRLAFLAQEEFAMMEYDNSTYQSIVNSINLSQKGNYIFHYDPKIFIIVANKIGYGNALVDCACAIENMMLMANELDLGSCWINQLHWLDDHATIREFLLSLGLKPDETVCGAISLGYTATDDGLPNRTPLARHGNKVTYVK